MEQLRESILNKINIIATNNFENNINNNINLLNEIIVDLEILTNHNEDDLLRQDAIFNVDDYNDYIDGIELFYTHILLIINNMNNNDNDGALLSANSANSILHNLNEYRINNIVRYRTEN